MMDVQNVVQNRIFRTKFPSRSTFLPFRWFFFSDHEHVIHCLSVSISISKHVFKLAMPSEAISPYEKQIMNDIEDGEASSVADRLREYVDLVLPVRKIEFWIERTLVGTYLLSFPLRVPNYRVSLYSITRVSSKSNKKLKISMFLISINNFLCTLSSSPVPPVIQSPHSVITVNESTPVMMTCIALGRPGPSLNWKKGGRLLTTDPGVNLTRSQPQLNPTTGLTRITTQLQVDRADFSDRGIYECIASTGKTVVSFSVAHIIELVVNGRLSNLKASTARQNAHYQCLIRKTKPACKAFQQPY